MDDILEFINFHLNNLVPRPVLFKDPIFIEAAFDSTVADFQYHYPDTGPDKIKNEIFTNMSLGHYLYRLVRELHLRGTEDRIKYQIHHIMKVLCGCEIYWSADIGEGFHIDHGMSTVIGSRCKIGKGFWIHHGCTVGHRSVTDFGEGPTIGDDVILYANSHIFGDITVGNKTVIGANSTVVSSTQGHELVCGNPAKRIKKL